MADLGRHGGIGKAWRTWEGLRCRSFAPRRSLAPVAKSRARLLELAYLARFPSATLPCLTWCYFFVWHCLYWAEKGRECVLEEDAEGGNAVAPGEGRDRGGERRAVRPAANLNSNLEQGVR